MAITLRIKKRFKVLKASIICDKEIRTILSECMNTATRIYNKLVYRLRREYENRKGEVDLSYKHLSAIIRTISGSKNIYAQSVENICKEVVRDFYSVSRKRDKDQLPGYRMKTTLSPIRYRKYGFKFFKINDTTYLTLSLGRRRQDGIKNVTVKLDSVPDIDLNKVESIKVSYNDRTDTFEVSMRVEVK